MGSDSDDTAVRRLIAVIESKVAAIRWGHRGVNKTYDNNAKMPQSISFLQMLLIRGECVALVVLPHPHPVSPSPSAITGIL